jgi:hypothetical protein
MSSSEMLPDSLRLFRRWLANEDPSTFSRMDARCPIKFSADTG